MAKVLLLSLASALVSAQQPEFHQQAGISQQANFNQQAGISQQSSFNQQADLAKQLGGPSPIDPSVSFNYGYEINDKDTGDAKTHQEALENGVLRGSYSVVQPDGNRRIVEYEADEISGFQAKVRYEPGYPIQAPPQRRQPAGAKVSSQGSRFSSGSSSKGQRPTRPSQGAQFRGSSQGSRFVGGAAAQRPRISIGSQSQGPRFGQHGPVLQGAPAQFIGGPPPKNQGSRPLSSSFGQGSSSSNFGQSSSSSNFGQSSSSPSFGQSSSSSSAGPISQGQATASASQGSRFSPARFPGAPSGSQFIGVSRTALPQPAGAGLTSITNLQGGAQGSRFSSGSPSQSASVLSQNAFASGASQVGQSGRPFSGPPNFGVANQGIPAGSRIQAGTPPSAPRPALSAGPRPALSASPRPAVSAGPRPALSSGPRPGASPLRWPVAPSSQTDVAVQIAPSGFFSQRGTASAGAIGAAQAGAIGAAQSGTIRPAQAGPIRADQAGPIRNSQAGALRTGQAGAIRASQAGAIRAGQASSSGAAFENNISASFFNPRETSNKAASAFQSGAGSRFAFQSGPGSRFQNEGNPSFDQLISSSLLVTNENLDNIDAVELASAGFDDSAYAYRLVPVPVNN